MKKSSTIKIIYNGRMSSYEGQIVAILLNEGINFKREYTFDDLKNGKYRYDFYLPERNILIEVDGQYHFTPVRGEQELKAQKERDRLKNSYALAHKIKLYRIPYWILDDRQVQTYKDITSRKFLVTSKWHNDRLRAPKN